MNRSNSGASFDIVHVILDIFAQIISFIISYSVWGRGIYTAHEWGAFATVYIVAILIFLLCNRSLNIYNSTIFFYLDRIVKRETVSFALAVCCAAVIFWKASFIEFNIEFMRGLCLVTYEVMILEILFFERILDRIIMRKYISRVLYVGSKDSYNKFRYFLKKTSIIINEIGYVSYDDNDDSLEYIGRLSDLEKLIRKYNIDQVYMLQKRDMDINNLQKYVDL